MRTKQNKDYSLAMVILYLIFSFLGGLTFSILALRAKRNNKTVFWWFLLALIFIGLFGVLSYSFVITSGPAKDPGWYYLGLSTLVANGIAVFILLVTLFTKSYQNGIS
jgi:peptidoglycan/LPS O-acetylase OafA/YrhL